jgi:hypothetical protein
VRQVESRSLVNCMLLGDALSYSMQDVFYIDEPVFSVPHQKVLLELIVETYLHLPPETKRIRLKSYSVLQSVSRS